MSTISPERPRRKILGIKLEKTRDYKDDFPSKFVDRAEGVVMVWRDGGDMPKRIYRPDEIVLAIRHANKLAKEHGVRFHVLRSWRAFEPEAGE